MISKVMMDNMLLVRTRKGPRASQQRDRTVASLQSYRGAGEKQVGSEAQPINAVRADNKKLLTRAPLGFCT